MGEQETIKRKILVVLLLPLLMLSFLSVGYAQLAADTSIISMSGKDWFLKVDSMLASSIDSRNTPYMTAKSSTEKELFLELESFEDCKSGVVQFKVDMAGLTAYKQLPLNLELDAKEYEFVNSTHAINNSQVVVYRPENIVNSFALFDDSGRKQAHISASKLVASDGATVWCDSNLEGGLLSVVLPLEWLETAKFPVVLDPIFGYTDVGATAETTTSYTRLNNYTVADDFTLDELWVYAYGAEGTEVRVALYNSTLDLLEETSALVLGGNATWLHEHMSSTVYDSGDYWVATTFSSGATIYYDDVAGNVFRYKFAAYGAFPASCSDSSVHANPSKFSVYVVYTEFTATPTPSPFVSATPFPEGDMSNTDWWISILVLLLIIINIFLMMLPFALVRFTFGILSLFLCMLALSYQIPLSPYLQTAGLLISVLAMLFSVRARE